MTARSEQRLRTLPWAALAGLAPLLDEPLAAVLHGDPAERVVDRTLRRLGPRDRDRRQAVAEALFGVALWRRRLAYHLGNAPASPRLLLACLVRDLGAYHDAETLLELPPTTLPPPRAPPRDLATRYSLPDWLADALLAEAGDEAAALADELGCPGPVCLRPNLLRVSPPELAEALLAEGVATRPGRLVPTSLTVTSPRPNILGLRAWQDALFEVQDEGSQLAGSTVEASPGDTVLDLCAGAGGKTLQLAAAVGASGIVYATDPDGERLERLRVRAQRAGAASIVRTARSVPPAQLLVDRVLVDAPCSELGALRRGPDRRFRADPRSFDDFPALQQHLLALGAAHVRPGGRLVYATCTFRRAENEEVATAFERAHPRFRRDSFRRTWPHREGCDGFFIASWRMPLACDDTPRER